MAVLLCIPANTQVSMAAATESVIFKNEFGFEYDQADQAWVIDAFDDKTGNVTLQFGKTLNKSIRFDQVTDSFVVSNNLSLGNNQLKDFSVDNRSTAPANPVVGQMYFNTTDGNTYVWNGLLWEDITDVGSSHTQNTDTGTTNQNFTIGSNASTASQDIALKFGGTLTKNLKWDATNARFAFDAPLRVEGNVAVVGQEYLADSHTLTNSNGTLNLGRSGNLWNTLRFDSTLDRFITNKSLEVGGNVLMNGNDFTLDADNTSTAGVNVQIIAKQGLEPNGVLRYNTVTNQWEISNNGGVFNKVADSSMQFETLYGWDTDKTLTTSGGNFTVNSGAGNIVMQSSNWNVNAAGMLNAQGVIARGNANVNGITSLNGHTRLGDASDDRVTFNAQVNSNVIPSTDLQYSLGSSTNRWKEIYVDKINAGAGNNVSFGQTGISFTFTNAQSTLVDGRTQTIMIGDVVKVNSTGTEEVNLTTNKNEVPIGIAANSANFGQIVEVIVLGKVQVNCTGSISVGELVQTSNTTGRVEQGGNSTKVLGMALSGCVGGKVYVVVHLM